MIMIHSDGASLEDGVVPKEVVDEAMAVEVGRLEGAVIPQGGDKLLNRAGLKMTEKIAVGGGPLRATVRQ